MVTAFLSTAGIGGRKIIYFTPEGVYNSAAMELDLFPSSPLPSDSKEPPVRAVFNIFAAVIAVFGFGLGMEGAHPYVGIVFMLLALGYGAWELLVSKPERRRFPLSLRITFLEVLLVLFVWVSWPHLSGGRIAVPLPAPGTRQQVVTVPNQHEGTSKLDITFLPG